MSPPATRYGLAVLLLAVIWICVYWWTPPVDPPLMVTRDEPFDVARPSLVSPEPQPTPVAEDMEDPSPPPLDEVDDTPELIPPEFEAYVVRKGDNAWSISRNVYGTPDYAMAVMRANPLQSFDRLKAGQTIRVPRDPSNVQGRSEGDVAPTSPTPEVIVYTVAPGDTLSEIAQKIYGRGSAWRVIRDANRDKIRRDDGSDIRPGMELMIPAPPSETP